MEWKYRRIKKRRDLWSLDFSGCGRGQDAKQCSLPGIPLCVTWQQSDTNEGEKDGGLDEVNTASVNYKPISGKAEKGGRGGTFISSIFSINLRKGNGRRLYESKSILSSRLKMFGVFLCAVKNNCYRTSKMPALFILNVVKRNIFRN